ncbi:MAG TPA: MaoC/PaaZ C-terminal domain-containing protein [Ornithinibacter sp.]|nr:MaoC/PaaZ C-terminal domain-containing protein [Ornithinibacter sp.]
MAVEILSGMPSTAPLLLRAALTARLPRGETVPERTLVVEGVRVDRDRLAAYQRLTGYAVDDTIPQPYPWVLAFPVQTALMARRDFPVPLPGMVHLGNRVTTHRRLDAADPLTLSVTAGALLPHRRGRTLDVRLEARVGDELVWECDSVYLSRGKGTEGAPRRDAPPALPVGTAAARWRLPEDLGRSYAGVSGDVNPIHLHALSAKVMGFPRPIAHGMWTYARTLAALGRASLGPSSSSVWFTTPVFLPSTVELVVDRNAEVVTAGLRSAKDADRAHLVLTLKGRDQLPSAR